ncbi:hypothetical protein IFR05_016565 [Cadophora sp. M221]|nr:hypothetical protein IFR05_016565 [Cadophora sp. M221]
MPKCKRTMRMTKLSKDSISLSRHNEDVVDTLRRIRLDDNLSTEEIRVAIDGVLSMAPIPLTPDEEENIPTASRDSSDEDEAPISGNEDIDVEVGSTESLDVTDVNTDRDDTRATGYMGNSSSVAWAKRTADAVQQEFESESATGKTSSAHKLSSYHTEDADIDFFDTSNIDCFDWPDPKLASILIQSYFGTVHDALPLIDKAKFMSWYEQFNRTSVTLLKDDFI